MDSNFVIVELQQGTREWLSGPNGQGSHLLLLTGSHSWKSLLWEGVQDFRYGPR